MTGQAASDELQQPVVVESAIIMVSDAEATYATVGYTVLPFFLAVISALSFWQAVWTSNAKDGSSFWRMRRVAGSPNSNAQPFEVLG